MDIEKLKKDWHFWLSIFGVVMALITFYNQTNFQFAKINEEILATNTSILGFKKDLKDQENKNSQQDLLEVEIKTKLNNIETTLIEIKQSIKK
jgi:hypothetical protein